MSEDQAEPVEFETIEAEPVEGEPALDPNSPKGRMYTAWKQNAKFVAQTWRPGTSGNPGGRRKKPPSVYEAVETILERIPKGQKQQVRELLAEVLVAKALKGDIKSLREILSRSDPAVLRLAGADGGPIEFASKLVVGIDPEAVARGEDPELPPVHVAELPERSEGEVDEGP